MYEGKSKRITVLAGGTISQYFKDDLTANNGEKKAKEVGKGIVANHISAYIFENLNNIGIPTHFIKRMDSRNQLIVQLSMIPIEVIVRNFAAGSICKRYDIVEGTPFLPVAIELNYKSDKLNDPLISESVIITQKIASETELAVIKNYSLRINDYLCGLFHGINIDLIDFKLEFGRDKLGRIVLGDEISPDGCRLQDRTTYRSLDKDIFRKGLGNVLPSYLEISRRFNIVIRDLSQF